MNKGIFRVIFNARQGERVVADEHARSSAGGLQTASASQPAAAQTSSNHVWFAARALAFASLCTFGMQPMVASAQANLPISAQGAGTTLGKSSNGTSVVNIAAPNQAGVSNNMFNQYNVGTAGVILNNSQTAAQTAIGGTVQGNAALTQGPANLVLLQVNGGSPSQLLGATEIAGKGANLVLANPAGITCSGCDFLNAPRVTLTTGTSVLDQNGAMAALLVKGGDIAIEGKGLSAKDSGVDLISRVMTINGAVRAKTIDAIGGSNTVDYARKTATVLNVGPGPDVSIDVQALGSMYGDGAVRLVSTGAGVGVRDNGKISSLTGDVAVSSNGDITIGAPASIAADSAVTLSGANVVNDGKLAADTVRVDATRSATNSGAMEGRNVIVNSNGSITSSGTLNASNGLFLIGARDVNLDGGSATAGGALYASAGGTLSNRGGTLKSGSTMNVDANRVDNTNGSMTSDDTVTVNAATVLNEGGVIHGAKDGAASVEPTTPEQGGDQTDAGQNPKPVDPAGEEMVTVLSDGGAVTLRRRELDQFAGRDLVSIGNDTYVPRNLLASMGFDENGKPLHAGPVMPDQGQAPVTPDHGTAPVDFITLMTGANTSISVPRGDLEHLADRDLVYIGNDTFAPRALLASMGRDQNGNPIVPGYPVERPVDPSMDERVTLVTPTGDSFIRRGELSQYAGSDLVYVGDNRYVPRALLSLVGLDQAGNPLVR
ncbi:filamentous hemagglutinin N-terminal domain-containing protein [Caballeronia sp. BR00000012568055]|uniref:two-partner secretion domain-containing protein n=1 Tax=Caballeronia sp. BR00000012568055 TaxID=2918761 RepID=UPI0023F7B875|nr:filamentous hemagglutinin N-terminal domain-containing protein [Caballeronia sp. BR00000012568055]